MELRFLVICCFHKFLLKLLYVLSILIVQAQLHVQLFLQLALVPQAVAVFVVQKSVKLLHLREAQLRRRRREGQLIRQRHSIRIQKLLQLPNLRKSLIKLLRINRSYTQMFLFHGERVSRLQLANALLAKSAVLFPILQPLSLPTYLFHEPLLLLHNLNMKKGDFLVKIIGLY